MELCFYICSCLSIISTVLVIFQKNAVYALLYLIISFLSISGIFFSVGAVFAGALEVIIYTGAILVLFVFVIMMLNLGDDHDIKEKKYFIFSYWLKPSILSLILLFSAIYVLYSLNHKMIEGVLIDSKSVGIELFSSYGLLVEFLSMLLLSALIVVFHIGKKMKT